MDLIHQKNSKLNEFSLNGITEQVTFSKTPFNIVLYGGGEGGDRNEQGDAHFHIYLNKTEEFRIKLPVKKLHEISINDLIEVDDSHILPNKIKKQLLTFLLSENDSSVDGKTNLEGLAELWNGINKFNPSANTITKEELKKYRKS